MGVVSATLRKYWLVDWWRDRGGSEPGWSACSDLGCRKCLLKISLDMGEAEFFGDVPFFQKEGRFNEHGQFWDRLAN